MQTVIFLKKQVVYKFFISYNIYHTNIVIIFNQRFRQMETNVSFYNGINFTNRQWLTCNETSSYGCLAA